LIGAFVLGVADPALTRQAVETVRTVIRRELSSDLDGLSANAPKNQPTAETGELGFTDGYDRFGLTITVGFGAPAYEKLGIVASNRPQDLISIPWEQLSDRPDESGQADLAVMISGDSPYVLEHVLRRLEHTLAEDLRLLWVVAGVRRHKSRSGGQRRVEGRGFVGFLDGTANLDPKHNLADRRLVFVDPEQVLGYPPSLPEKASSGRGGPVLPADLREPPRVEPSWTRSGSYVVVRSSVIDIDDWDTRSLGEQEHVIGRFKLSGSGLHAVNDPSRPPGEPVFADADGSVTPLDAHIRKANPRGSGDDLRRIFRRGYPLLTVQTNRISRGVLFVCFGRTISTQFEFITRAWTTNPDFPRPGSGLDALRAYERVLSGGYFFVPPIADAKQPWSWVVPAG
jgi:deferrochelatase/peroxidase EfeB